MEKQLTRKEVYSLIKNNNLQEEVKKTFGKNYTNVPTKELSDFLYLVKLSREEATKKKESKKCTHNVCCSGINIEDIQELFALIKLVDILRKKNILLASELDAIFNNCPPEYF